MRTDHEGGKLHIPVQDECHLKELKRLGLTPIPWRTERAAMVMRYGSSFVRMKRRPRARAARPPPYSAFPSSETATPSLASRVCTVRSGPSVPQAPTWDRDCSPKIFQSYSPSQSSVFFSPCVFKALFSHTFA